MKDEDEYSWLRDVGDVNDDSGLGGVERGLYSDRIQGSSRFAGVRVSTIIKNLPPEVGIERNLIKVPICVSNAIRAKTSQFIYEFAEREIDGERCIPKLILSSGRGTPLPLPQHAKVLDVLIAMLAHNFNDEGEVYFSFNDVSRHLGHCLTQNKVIKEAIRRYHFNSIFFERCWVLDKGRFTSEVFQIITKTDLYDGDLEVRNPGRSRKKLNLHYVKFAKEIVESVKKNFIRLFPKEAFSDLDAGTYMLYKLFYAPTDREPIIRSLNYIANFLGWGDRVDRLKPWVKSHLEILKKKEFILWWRTNGDCFEVCSNAARFKRHIAELRRLNPARADQKKAIALKESRKKAKLVGEESNKAVCTEKKKDQPITAGEIARVQAIIAEVVKMGPHQQAKFLGGFTTIPEQDRDGFDTFAVIEFLKKQKNLNK